MDIGCCLCLSLLTRCHHDTNDLSASLPSSRSTIAMAALRPTAMRAIAASRGSSSSSSASSVGIGAGAFRASPVARQAAKQPKFQPHLGSFQAENVLKCVSTAEGGEWGGEREYTKEEDGAVGRGPGSDMLRSRQDLEAPTVGHSRSGERRKTCSFASK